MENQRTFEKIKKNINKDILKSFIKEKYTSFGFFFMDDDILIEYVPVDVVTAPRLYVEVTYSDYITKLRKWKIKKLMTP